MDFRGLFDPDKESAAAIHAKIRLMNRIAQSLHIFNGEGNVRSLLRAHDWSSSPLGDPQIWPQELRTAAELMLESRFPAVVAWGPELVFLYNDAYAYILGDRHPGALGCPFHDVWPEIWPEISPIIENTLAGNPSCFEDVPFTITTDGVSRQRWFTSSYSPVRTGDGTVAGVCNTAIETTDRVLVEKRQAFQLELVDLVRPLIAPEQITAASCELLGQRLGASRVFYAEVDDPAGNFVIRQDWVRHGQASMAGETRRLANFGPAIIAVLRKGKATLVDDIACDPRTAEHAGAYTGIDVRSYLAIPLVKSGRLVALLTLHRTEPYRWTEWDIQLSEDTAERTWLAVENARAQAELRIERDRSQYIFDSMTEGFAMLDRDWTVLQINAEGLRIVQRTKSEVIGRNHREVWPDLTDTETGMLYRRVRETGSAGIAEELFLRPDGERIWLELRAYPALDRGLAVFFRDVTERRLTEEALRNSETRSATALAIAQLGTFDWNIHTGWVECSARTYEIFAFAGNEGNAPEHYFERILPGDSERVQHEFAAALNADGVVRTEYRIRLPNGDIRHIVSMSACQRNSSGAWTRHVGVFNDITESRRAETALRYSEAHLSSLFQQTAAGIVETDTDGRLISVNDRYCRILGRSRDELIGQSVWDLTHPDDLARNIPFFEKMIRTGEPYEIEKRYRCPDGSPVWVSKTVSLIRAVGDRLTDSALAVVLDITERKHAEEKLKEADRRKDEFLAMLAHELRNPLAPIGAAAELLKLVKLDEARVRQTSEIIGRQVQHMTSLVDDLLDVSRVTRGLVKLEKAPLDIRHIVTDAVEQVTPLIQSRRHHLVLHLPPDTTTVMGDRKRLVQVIANILNNAAKYTQEGGNILLKTEVDDDHVVLGVLDDGIGMAPELVTRVFDLFAQAERTSDRSQGGLGLGLALVKSLVELHGGTVTCSSEGVGKGSKFSICLPRMPDRDKATAQMQSNDGLRKSNRMLRLMVVDDNADAARMLAMFLEASGHQVIVEHESRRALERARIEVLDACLLDIGLPDMDGNELAQRLRAQPGAARCVLIAVTGYGQEHDRESAQAAGFDHYLVKPVDTAKLAGVLAGIGAC